MSVPWLLGQMPPWFIVYGPTVYQRPFRASTSFLPSFQSTCYVNKQVHAMSNWPYTYRDSSSYLCTRVTSLVSAAGWQPSIAFRNIHDRGHAGRHSLAHPLPYINTSSSPIVLMSDSKATLQCNNPLRTLCKATAAITSKAPYKFDSDQDFNATDLGVIV